MYPRLTDDWDEQVGAIDTGARRLAELPQEARQAALNAIHAAVTEHVRVVPDDLLAKAAVAFADDLYKAACGIDRWDDALDVYLAASAGTMSARLTERGLHLTVPRRQCLARPDEAVAPAASLVPSGRLRIRVPRGRRVSARRARRT
jgi:hypothetical protein